MTNVTSAVPWTDHRNADPIMDLRSLVANQPPTYGDVLHVDIPLNAWLELAQCSTVLDRDMLAVTPAAIEKLLQQGVKIKIISERDWISVYTDVLIVMV